MLTPLIPDADQRRIRHFVDEVFLPRAVTIVPGGPEDMMDGPPDISGWRPWKPVDNPVTDDDILLLERWIGDSLPSLFRAWLMCRCLLMTDVGSVQLPELPSPNPLEPFREFVSMIDSQPYFRPRRVIPFGTESVGIGPLCFDVKGRLPDGDCPVLLLDSELLGDPNYHGRPFTGSFAALLDRVEAEILSYDSR